MVDPCSYNHHYHHIGDDDIDDSNDVRIDTQTERVDSVSQDIPTSIFTETKHIIIIVGVLLGILCMLLSVAMWYFGRVLIYDLDKLSDHIDLEMEMKHLSGEEWKWKVRC